MTTIEIRLSQAMDKLREKRGAIPQCVGAVPTANAREYRMTFAKAVSQHHMTNIKEVLPGCTFLLPVECDPSKACIVLVHVPEEWVTEEQPAAPISDPEIIDLVTGEPAAETTTHVKITPAAKTAEQRIREAFAGAHGGKIGEILPRSDGTYRLNAKGNAFNREGDFGRHKLLVVEWIDDWSVIVKPLFEPSGTPVPEALDSAELSALKSFYGLATTNPDGYWTTTFATAPERATEHLATVRGMLDKSADMAHGAMYRINAKGADAIGKPYPPKVANVRIEPYTAADEVKALEARLAAAQERIGQIQADLETAQRRVDDLTAKDARITDPGWTFVRVEDWNRDQATLKAQGRMLAEAAHARGERESRIVITPFSMQPEARRPMVEVDDLRAGGWSVRHESVVAHPVNGSMMVVTIMERLVIRDGSTDPAEALIERLNAEIQPEIDDARKALAGVVAWERNAPAIAPVLASGRVQS